MQLNRQKDSTRDRFDKDKGCDYLKSIKLFIRIMRFEQIMPLKGVFLRLLLHFAGLRALYIRCEKKSHNHLQVERRREMFCLRELRQNYDKRRDRKFARCL